MDTTGIRLNDSYDNDEYKTRTLYFDAPKSLLDGRYPEADAAEISVEFPIDSPETKNCSVSLSPVKDGSSYDWTDWDIPYEDVEKLLDLASRNKGGHHAT